MGNVEIDLRSAHLGAGVSEMEVNCLMGNIEITIPPEVRVLCDGHGLLGSFDVERIGNTTPPPDAPTIRVTGTAYLGAITVTVVDSQRSRVGGKAQGWMGDSQGLRVVSKAGQALSTGSDIQPARP